MILEGQVDPEFESVRRLFERNMRTLAERNTQLCVFVEGECVVDLWGSAIDDKAFSPDSLVNVFSSGKSLEAIALAMLNDRGLLDYNARITQYWPEFAGGEDCTTTVADLMRHEAGLAAFDTTLEPTDLHRDALKRNAIGAIIERQKQRYPEGENNQREYHAITRGWIANEVFRRIEPAGRTLGEFLRAEISTPLETDVHIGLLDEELPRLSNVAMLGFGYQFAQGLLPKVLGRKVELNLPQTVLKLARLRSGMRRRTATKSPVPIRGMNDIRLFDSREVAQGEIPSAGAKCSARGLARLASVMANRGRFGTSQLMSEGAWEAAHDGLIERSMMAITTRFSQAGLASFYAVEPGAPAMDRALNTGREGFYGWMGLGGSIFQWHPERRIGFAYVPTSLNVLDLVNERGKSYQQQVLRVLDDRQ